MLNYQLCFFSFHFNYYNFSYSFFRFFFTIYYCECGCCYLFVFGIWCFGCFVHQNSLQVRSLAHDLSCRLPVLDALKGSHETSHHGGGYAGICLGDPDIGELTISEMSPEDIRAELKRYVICIPISFIPIWFSHKFILFFHS